MKKLIIISMYLMAVFATSCKKEHNYEFEQMVEKSKAKNSKAIETLNDANINNTFDWKTTKDVSITLTGYANSQVIITTLDGKPIDTFMIKTNEAYTTIINIPTSERKVVLNYMGQMVVLDVNTSKVDYHFN